MIVWGSVGEWISGLGALAAVIATVVFSRRAERARASETAVERAQYTDEVKRREAAEGEVKAQRAKAVELARTAQARRIFVWRVWDDGSGRGDGVSMHNGSDLPVFDVAVSGYEPKSGARVVLDSETSVAAVVLPGGGCGAPSDGDLSTEVWVTFTDANGTSWARSGTANSWRA